jgi:hypothetical protein
MIEVLQECKKRATTSRNIPERKKLPRAPSNLQGVIVMTKSIFWTAEEKEWLVANYENLGMLKCSNHLGRTPVAIRHQASKLGVKRKGQGRKPRLVDMTDGYFAISSYNHRERVHRIILGKHLGREIQKGEIVHHVNEDKADNIPENLEVVTRSKHMAIHCKTRPRNKKGQFVG